MQFGIVGNMLIGSHTIRWYSCCHTDDEELMMEMRQSKTSGWTHIHTITLTVSMNLLSRNSWSPGVFSVCVSQHHTILNPPAADRQARRQQRSMKETHTGMRKRRIKDLSIFGISRALKKTEGGGGGGSWRFDPSPPTTAPAGLWPPRLSFPRTKHFWKYQHLPLVVASSALSPHTRGVCGGWAACRCV